jgi:hypothetical protein
MNARPLLERLARALAARRLDAVLVGNAAAALQGAPVTTLDFDFMFRKTAGNLRKLRAVARDLGAVILTPFYPASELFRVVNDDLGLQADFMPKLDGIRSFEGLRARATAARIGDAALLVADLRDVIRSKRATNRARDRAVIPVSRRRYVKKRGRATRAKGRDARRRESARALREQIRRLLARPMHARTHFLRVRLPGGGSTL